MSRSDFPIAKLLYETNAPDYVKIFVLELKKSTDETTAILIVEEILRAFTERLRLLSEERLERENALQMSLDEALTLTKELKERLIPTGVRHGN
jgi:hypothetical protein|tara:strand:- start:4026 stop:4307 length:282 start_codon:yes stop_codon:yes gene_type:complete